MTDDTQPVTAADPHGEAQADAPIAHVRSDVGRIAAVFRSIHSRYVWSGIALYVAAAVSGVLVALLTPLSDGFMHAIMYGVIFTFLMFYIRAHQVQRRVGRALYALTALALLAFFAWVLGDLIPPRLMVIDGAHGPSTAMRAAADGLMAPIVLLIACAAWLLFHWLVLGRFHHDAPAADR